MLGILPSAIIACSSVTTSNPGGGSAGTSGRASISDAGAVSANGFGGRSTSGSSNAGGSGRTSSGSGGTSANASGAANGSGSGDNTPKGVVVKLDAKHQTIQGFGLSTAWMPSGKNLPVDKVFGTDGADAIGLSILRVVMNPNGTLTGPF